MVVLTPKSGIAAFVLVLFEPLRNAMFLLFISKGMEEKPIFHAMQSRIERLYK